jgi:hypothetical protein
MHLELANLDMRETNNTWGHSLCQSEMNFLAGWDSHFPREKPDIDNQLSASVIDVSQ